MRSFLLFLFLPLSVWSSQTLWTKADFEPDSIYSGCVNVITGEYVESHLDLAVRAQAPLFLDRHMAGSSERCGSFATGTLFFDLDASWHNQRPCTVERERRPDRCKLYLSYPGHGALEYRWFERPCGRWSPTAHRFYCNQGGGDVSGRNNPRNQVVTYEGGGDFIVRGGDGGRALYRFDVNDSADLYATSLIKGELKEHQLPSGATLSYKRKSSPLSGLIEARSPGGELLGSIRISSKEGGARTVAKGSDGQQLSIWRRRGGCGKEVARVELEGHPAVDYTYFEGDLGHPSLSTTARRPIKREEPCGRYLEFSYYTGHKTQVGKEVIDYSHIPGGSRRDGHPIIGRVRRIFAPVGDGGERAEIAEFRYTFDFRGGGKPDHYSGETAVRDGCGTVSKYWYDYGRRLTHYRTYDASGLLRSIRFLWGHDQHNVGDLLGKLVSDGEGQPRVAYWYEYDRFGNVTKESIWGNLTGSGRLKVDAKHVPIPSRGVECHGVEMAYTLPAGGVLENRFSNLLVSRREMGREDRYTYLEGTDLIASHEIVSDGTLFKKTSYSYDDEHFLTERREQCGCVHKIWRFERFGPGPLFGFVRREEELFVDGDRGEERLLSAVERDFDPKTKLVQCEHYFDGCNQERYTLTYGYDRAGRRTYFCDALGREFEWCYDENGNLCKELGPRLGSGVSYSYDLANRLTKVRRYCPEGSQTTSYEYDVAGRVTLERDWLGVETRYGYDGLGRRTEEHFADGSSRYKTWDVLGGVSSFEDELGNATHFTYNSRGQQTRASYPDGTHEKSSYDLKGRRVYHRARDGVVTRWSYNPLDQVVRKEVVSADGAHSKVTTFGYLGDLLAWEVNPMGLETTYGYDGAGRLISKKRGAALEEYGYDALGNRSLIRTWYGDGHFFDRICTFDLLGRLVGERVIDEGSLLRYLAYQYDERGNLVATYEGDQPLEQRRFDGFDRPTCIVTTNGQTLIEYKTTNCDGYRLEQRRTTDGLGNVTLESFDLRGRLFCRESLDSSGEMVSQVDYTYDGAGNVIEECYGPSNQTVERTFDPCGRLLSLKGPDGCGTMFEHDLLGRLVCKTAADGSSTHYEYDGFGRLISQACDGRGYTFEYDLDDRLILSRDEEGRETYREYNALGALTFERQASGLEISYDRDCLGRRTALRFSDGSFATYRYNGLDLLGVARFDASGDFLYDHVIERRDLGGRPECEILPFDVGERRCEWDEDGRLTAMRAPTFALDLFYDGAGNLERRVSDGATTTFEYDALGQLTVESGAHTWQNDAVYNQLVVDGVEGEFDLGNRLLRRGDSRFEYDRLGRLISKGGADRFSYDDRGRLIEADVGGERYSYIYDLFDRRVARRSSGGERLFLYDGLFEVAEFEGKTPLAVRIPGEFCAIAIERGKSCYVPLFDSRGDLMRLLSPSGDVVESFSYSAFGVVSAPSDLSPWLFQGKRLDRETGLYCFGCRCFDPALARWLSPDPAGYDQGPNLYQYGLNNPYGYIDPDGRFVIVLPLLYFGAGIALPTLSTVVASVAYSAAAATVVWGGCMVNEYVNDRWGGWGPMLRSPSKNYEEAPPDLSDKKKWKDVSHPEQKKAGHREFVNDATGERIRVDKGKPGETGHKERDHYHRYNPKATGKHNEYLDAKGNPVPKNHDRSHLHFPYELSWD